MERKYIVTKEQLPALVREAYALSVPQGMGFLHARPGGLDEETVTRAMAYVDEFNALDLDYLHGRAIKMWVRADKGTGHFAIDADRWYDHSKQDLDELAKRVGLQEMQD